MSWEEWLSFFEIEKLNQALADQMIANLQRGNEEDVLEITTSDYPVSTITKKGSLQQWVVTIQLMTTIKENN